LAHRFHPDRLVPGSIHHYLPDNHRLAGRLLGQRLRTVTRLLDVPAQDEPRLGYGPALLTGQDGEQWLIDTEESKANVLFLSDVTRTMANSFWYSRMTIQAPIAEPVPGHRLRSLVTEAIASVEVISRDPEEGVPDSFAMCGVRLTTTGGTQICAGTHLTDLMISEVAFLTPPEVDPGLYYAPL
jgi:hypothetical protein